MKILAYIALVFADIAANVIALLINWFLPLFALGEDHLPGWLGWFDTPDNPLDGDQGFLNESAPFTGLQTGVRRFINRVAWLYRNRAYGFAFSILGRRINTIPKVVSGELWIGNEALDITTDAVDIHRRSGQSGSVYIECDDEKCWEWYYVRQWGSTSKCLRIRLGWKLSGYVQNPKGCPTGTVAQFVFSINPLMHFDTSL